MRRVLYLAATWDATNPPSMDVVLHHPELVIYHQGWGRVGDFGVVAEQNGNFIGGAYGRLFTEDVHGYGYVDDETPEIAIAVEAEYRGQGLGTTLMKEIADQARGIGLSTLSLSVEGDNPAMALYRRLGYRDLDADKPGERMVLRLEAP